MAKPRQDKKQPLYSKAPSTNINVRDRAAVAELMKRVSTNAATITLRPTQGKLIPAGE